MGSSFTEDKRKREGVAPWVWIVLITALAVFACVAVARCPSDNPKEQTRHSRPHIEGLEKVINPPGRTSRLKRYEGFTVSFNSENGTPNWSAWELLGDETLGSTSRSNRFWQDDEVEGCPHTSDYTNSNYDRGHMAPAADMKWSNQAMRDCFVLTNICPQDHALNSGAWKTLEDKCRLWAQRDSALVIVAGPIYDRTDRQRIGSNEVRVPSAFFKVILAPYVESPRAIGFIYPNRKSPGNMRDYSMTVDEVERLTGYDFFSALPDELENEVEGKTSFTEWNRR